LDLVGEPVTSGISGSPGNDDGVAGGGAVPVYEKQGASVVCIDGLEGATLPGSGESVHAVRKLVQPDTFVPMICIRSPTISWVLSWDLLDGASKSCQAASYLATHVDGPGRTRAV